MGNFERWPFDDLNVLSSRPWRRILIDGGAAKEQAARYSGGRPYHEQYVHRTDPLQLALYSRDREMGVARRPPYMSWRYGIGIHGNRRDAANISRAGELSQIPN
jgi:hypothetical protein